MIRNDQTFACWQSINWSAIVLQLIGGPIEQLGLELLHDQTLILVFQSFNLFVLHAFLEFQLFEWPNKVLT